ncbi:MBL fold metallo-hydrolase [Salinirubellus salinus]|uniref:MBL fold metallo-hydrolase n=1 Tax=Salinirubellus salinus TaxID=1364945 RepID=A0A9E7U605_9EURY|nr:MBL fold metallo-hydrolase [Salinirubellus salinus]UWM55980.1 MBL fold metallo-hydrolase [Salinirubellus salinus]
MSESRTQSVAGAHRIEFEVDWPPGHVACYVLGGSEPVLVDAGMPTDDESDHDREGTLRDGLAAVGLEPADVEHLLVTHPHVDHVGQVPTVLEAADPTVHAPAGVEERFGRDVDTLGDRVRENARSAGLTGDQLADAVEMATKSLRRDSHLLPADRVDHWVTDGERFTLGEHDLRAVHAPGHQADLLCYELELGGENALLAGDMAMEPFRGVAIHDGLDDGVFEAFEAFYDALDRLADLDVDRVYPGHGAVHDEFQRVLERDRGSLDRRLEGVADALADGVRTVPGVAVSIAGERPVRYILPEAFSALAHLERVGRATVTVEDGVRYYDPA